MNGACEVTREGGGGAEAGAEVRGAWRRGRAGARGAPCPRGHAGTICGLPPVYPSPRAPVSESMWATRCSVRFVGVNDHISLWAVRHCASE